MRVTTLAVGAWGLCVAGLTLAAPAPAPTTPPAPKAPARPPAAAPRPPATQPGPAATSASAVGPATRKAAPAPAAKPRRGAIKVSTARKDGSKLNGNVTHHDVEGFTIVDANGVTQKVKWFELSPVMVYNLYERLFIVAPTANDWLAAGGVLYRLKDGGEPAEKAFLRATKLDPKAVDRIEDAKAGRILISPMLNEGIGEEEEELLKAMVTGGTKAEVLKRLWSKQTDAQQAASVAVLKEFAEETRYFKEGTIRLLETKYFLFYTDLKPAEAQNWAGLLDKMYARLAELFNIPKSDNIFRGKALVFVFSKEADYLKFEQEEHETDAKKTLGICHSYQAGWVHISFFRQPDEQRFAHLLVHESTHGFVHRYRSYVPIPSWINEGLADEIAYQLVPKVDESDKKPLWNYTRSYVNKEGMGPEFFTTRQISGDQYPVARFMSMFMLAKKPKYVAFLNALKDGSKVEDALVAKYDMTLVDLEDKYRKYLGLQPK